MIPSHEMAPHSSPLAWKIPWTVEPGRLQSMGSLRVGHNWVTSLSLFTFMHWRRKWQPTPVFLPGESQGWGSLQAAIYGVAQSLTRLKRLSSSSSSSITWKKANCIAMKIFWVYFSPSFIRLTYTHMNSQKVLQEECGGAVAKVDLGFRQHDLNTFP